MVKEYSSSKITTHGHPNLFFHPPAIRPSLGDNKTPSAVTTISFFTSLQNRLYLFKIELPQEVILQLEYSLAITLLLNEYSFPQSQQNVPFYI